MKRVGTKLPDGGYQVDIVTDHGRVAERAVYDATGVLVTRSYSEAFLRPESGGPDPSPAPRGLITRRWALLAPLRRRRRAAGDSAGRGR
jgi:hypothetical protein